MQGLSKSLHFFEALEAGYFPFSAVRRRGPTVHVDVLPRLHLISTPSPYTNNSQLLLSPTSPFPSHHSIPDIAPSQLPFHYAILAPSSASPLSCLFPVSHLHSIRSRLTPSIGAFFISFSLRFLVIARCFSPIRSDMPRFLSFSARRSRAIHCHYRTSDSHSLAAAFILLGIVNIHSVSVAPHTPFWGTLNDMLCFLSSNSSKLL